MTGITSDDEIMGALDALPQPTAPAPSFTARLAHDFSQAADTAGGLAQFNAQEDPAIATGRAVAQDVGTPGFGERFSANVRAGFTRAIEADNLAGDDNTLREQYEPLVEAANKGLPPEQWIPNPMSVVTAGGPFANRRQPGMTREEAEGALWSRVAALRQTDPGAAGNLPKDKAELMEDVRAEQRTAIAYSDMLSKNSGPVSGGLAQFIGQAAGAQTDAPNIIAAMGAPASSSLLRTFLTEGALNASADLAGIPTRMQRYQDLGTPMSVGDAAEEAAGAFVLGGALPTAGKALGHIFSRTADAASPFLEGKPLLDAFDHAVPEPPPIARSARAVVEDEVNRAASNPFVDSDAGRDAHRVNLDTAAAAMDQGNFSAVPDHAPAADLEAKARALAPQAFAARDDAMLAAVREVTTQGGGDPDALAAAHARMQDVAPQIEEAYRHARGGGLAPDAVEKAPVADTAEVTAQPAEAPRAVGRPHQEAGQLDLFADPANKPEAFRQQSQDLAREIAGYDDVAQFAANLGVKIERHDKGGLNLFIRSGETRHIHVSADQAASAGLTEPQALAHEIGHAVVSIARKDMNTKEGSANILAAFPGLRAEIEPVSRAFKPKVWEKQPHYAARPEEMLADAVAVWLIDPTSRARMPELQKALGGVLKNLGADVPNEFGPAQGEIQALRRLDQKSTFADPRGDGEISVQAARGEIERQARATEFLRGCVEDV